MRCEQSGLDQKPRVLQRRTLPRWHHPNKTELWSHQMLRAMMELAVYSESLSTEMLYSPIRICNPQRLDEMISRQIHMSAALEVKPILPLFKAISTSPTLPDQRCECEFCIGCFWLDPIINCERRGEIQGGNSGGG